ncbi:MAG: glycosyltransferase family 4 protein [Rhizobiaceae bacterium]|nr:glycosyltransferase family 4 protein [Rhizobiaceae bacterium]
MRIGVDARTLVVRKTGIGRYVHEAGKALIAAGHDLVFYWPERVPVPDGLEAAAHRHGAFPGSLGRILWSMSALPRQAACDGLDVFWGPAHRLPVGLPDALPAVLTVHDLVWAVHPQTMRRRGLLAERLLMPPALRRADRIVAVSDATKNEIAGRFPQAAQKTITIHPGTTALPTGAGSAGKVPDRPYALFVGTIEPRKNLAGLLRALALLRRDKNFDGRLLIVGGTGWRQGHIGEEVERLKLDATVSFAGYVSDEELAGLYAGARFLAMPSLYEGFGFPIIEANRCGLAVLTSNVSSMPEVAGATAHLVDPLDERSIADGFWRLWTDDAYRARLAAVAPANVERFRWTDSAAQLAGVFSALKA